MRPIKLVQYFHRSCDSQFEYATIMRGHENKTQNMLLEAEMIKGFECICRNFHEMGKMLDKSHKWLMNIDTRRTNWDNAMNIFPMSFIKISSS